MPREGSTLLRLSTALISDTGLVTALPLKICMKDRPQLFSYWYVLIKYDNEKPDYNPSNLQGEAGDDWKVKPSLGHLVTFQDHVAKFKLKKKLKGGECSSTQRPWVQSPTEREKKKKVTVKYVTNTPQPVLAITNSFNNYLLCYEMAL